MKTGEKNVRILYTSDIHGRLFARPGEAGLDETGREFRRDGNTLIFDGGDLLQGGTAGTFFAREIWAGVARWFGGFGCFFFGRGCGWGVVGGRLPRRGAQRRARPGGNCRRIRPRRL